MSTYTKQDIKNLIATNDKAVVRGLLALYERQTDAEKNAGVTSEDNGIGFSGVDSEILSKFAEWYKAKGFLTTGQLALTRKKIAKYARQLLDIAASNGHTVVYK